MSELIPFPKLKQKLCSDIKQAIAQEQYELAYDCFVEYEQYFEMTEALALMKCHVLWETQSYLELREEAHILLEQGNTSYDELMIYYVKSLFALEQYQSVVSVVDEILNSVKAHQTRMILLPTKDQAQHQLNKRQEQMKTQLQQFDQLSEGPRTELILSMIDDSVYYFADTMAYLITQDDVSVSLQSLMLEYLRFARYNQSIQLEVNGQELSVVPAQLEGFDVTRFMKSIVPEVIARLENDYPSLVQEARIHLNTHNIAMYPFDITQLADDQTWIQTYVYYFEEMIGVSPSTSADTCVLSFIKLLNT
ncbi:MULTISPECIES: hypothetical protein [unclassified Staphylococcus]|uniref:hypothetical protein n=1 Tax=unclassified Staphylococcus TaxID=91994 RepID=UPI0021CF8203|nr:MULTISPECIES: hypothetical protein [unclassified Staphylococcus]UXR77431.1 hypothetical protein MUA92_06000 [Staphylococcus sp. IVB6227]UXR81694.1 hypothetical protein MUA51_06240 [Staphylococcus sp. IVB6214]